MYRGFFGRGVALVSVLLAGLGLAGCASLEKGPPEQVVTKLANERWKFLVAEDWNKAYELLVPSYRSLHSLNEYRNSFARSVRWVGGEVVAANCEAVKCTLRVQITTLLPLARRPGETISTNVDETWLLEDGKWYYYQAP